MSATADAIAGSDVGGLADAECEALLGLARESIGCGLAGSCRARPARSFPLALLAPGACFVTLALDGALRGCCGSIEPRRALVDDVWHNAYASAFRDPRFAPLGSAELERLQVEITLLSALEPLAVADEADLAGRLTPRLDGLVLELGGQRVTFLPQVWASVSSPEEFIHGLKAKAGWSAAFWTPALRCYRYRARSFED